MVDVKGIPDESSNPSVFQNFTQQSVHSNGTPATAGTWSIDFWMWQHPVIFMSWRKTNSDGTVVFGQVLNQGVGAAGSTYADKNQAVWEGYERYRVAYMSTTGHLDCNATTNSGSVAAAQFPMMPLYCGIGRQAALAPAGSRIDRLAEVWVETPKTYAQLMTMPNAYNGRAEFGHYMPLRLTRTCQQWTSAKDLVSHVNQPAGISIFATYSTEGGVLPASTGAQDYPYGLATTYTGGAITQLRRSDVMCGQISYTNLHQSSSIVMTIRAGYECQVSAASPLCPFMRVSPSHDELALHAYYAISRELKDAYPEEYNSVGKILKDIALAAADALSGIIPGGNIMWAAAKNLFLPNAKSGGSAYEDLSAAQKEKVKDEQAARTILNARKRIAQRKK